MADKKQGVKRLTEIDKTPLQTHSSNATITDLQKQVLYLIVSEHLGQVEISRRLKTSRQNINQIVKRLRKNGLLDKQNLTALQKGGAVTIKKSVSTAKWRYHKLHFVVKPFYFEPRYHKWRLEKGNIFYSGDWRFVLHEDIVEVQIREFVDFLSVSKWECLDKATKSFNRQLNIEANRYGFHVFKEGKANIRICDQHLEESNSGVAKGRDNDSYVAIRGFHDNKIYFTFDKSKGYVNREYVHSDLAISDSEKFEPFFNSIRYHDHYLPHETKEILDTILGVQMEYANQIRLHLETMQNINQGILRLSEAVKKLEEKMK